MIMDTSEKQWVYVVLSRDTDALADIFSSWEAAKAFMEKYSYSSPWYIEKWPVED